MPLMPRDVLKQLRSVQSQHYTTFHGRVLRHQHNHHHHRQVTKWSVKPILKLVLCRLLPLHMHHLQC